jgi:hypothetical protein
MPESDLCFIISELYISNINLINNVNADALTTMQGTNNPTAGA